MRSWDKIQNRRKLTILQMYVMTSLRVVGEKVMTYVTLDMSGICKTKYKINFT